MIKSERTFGITLSFLYFEYDIILLTLGEFKIRILVVEDNQDLLESIVVFLEKNGFSVDGAICGEDALEFLSYIDYDTILLDVNLPDYSGFDICKIIRKQNEEHIPIIMVTARDEVSDRVHGLDSGADDYLVKPFDFEELRARIHAVLRRSYDKKSLDITIGDIVIKPAELSVEIGGNIVFFPAKEYELLYFLSMNHPNPVSTEQMLEHVWDDEVNPFSNSVRVHIMNIRKKLAEHSKNVTIENIKKRGYYLCTH